MIFRLLLLFTLVPFVELVLLLQIHHAISTIWGPGIGLLVTLGSIVLTGIAGAALARQQGLGVLRKFQSQTRQGQLPGDALADGMLILFGAALLLTPGILSDVLGFSLLIPFTRNWHRRLLLTWAKHNAQVHSSFQQTDFRNGGFPTGGFGYSEQVDVFVVDPHRDERSTADPSRAGSTPDVIDVTPRSPSDS